MLNILYDTFVVSFEVNFEVKFKVKFKADFEGNFGYKFGKISRDNLVVNEEKNFGDNFMNNFVVI